MRTYYKRFVAQSQVLLFTFLFIGLINISQAQNPDAVYPIPNNGGTESVKGINLFTGNVGYTTSLIQLNSAKISYSLDAYYNSGSVHLVNSDTSKYVFNALGGYGWKMMDYPKIVQDDSSYYLLDGKSSYPLQSLGSNAYTPGGKYYLWRVIKNGSNWEIAKEDGTHYLFNSSPHTQVGGSQVWSFSMMKDVVNQDSIQFVYSTDGTLSRMTNPIGDTILFTYDTIQLTYRSYLKQIQHKKKGAVLSVVNLSYTPYTRIINSLEQRINPSVAVTYQHISEITYQHSIANERYSQLNASTKFSYFDKTTTDPFGGNNYEGALSNITTPSGAIYSYSYIPRTMTKMGYKTVLYTVNDGYGSQTDSLAGLNTFYAITYDTANLFIESDSVYTFYNKVDYAPGGRFDAVHDSLRFPHGNIEYYFLNGLPSTSLSNLPANYPTTAITNTTLKGHLYQKKVNADTSVRQADEIATIQNFWDLGYLSSGTVGGFPKLQKTYDEKYNIGKWMTYQYGTPYQLPVSVATSRRNPDPTTTELDKDSIITQFSYAFQHYSDLTNDAIYIINKVARTTQSVQPKKTGAFAITACNCTPWTKWNATGLPNNTYGYWAPVRQVKMRNSSADTANCLSTTATSNNWFVTENISLRGVYAQPMQLTDVRGTTVSNILPTASYGAMPIATFKNSDLHLSTANASYLGFEEYETLNNWTASSPRYNTNYAHTGKRSFSGSLRRTFRHPESKTRVYKVGLWTRVANTGDGCNIRIRVNGRVVASVAASYEAGKSTLRYLETSATVQSGQTIQVSLNTTGNAFLDDVTFMPVDAQMQATVFDMNKNVSTAKLGLNGATTHLVRNRFNSLVASVGPGSVQNVNNLNLPYNSRRGNRFIHGTDVFNTQYPNMVLKASAKSGGNWQGFEYASNNSFPSQNLTNMSIQDGWLQATDTGAIAIYNHTTDSANMAFYTEVFPNQLATNEEIGMALQLNNYNYGDSLIGTQPIKFVITHDSLKLYSGQTVYASKAISHVLNSTSLFLSISDNNHVLCYANGRYVFDHEFVLGKISGPLKLITNNIGGAFDNFIFISKPNIHQIAYDGLNRPKQRLKRINKDQIGVSEILYGGPQDLPLAQTRDAIVGGGGDDMSMSYKEDLVSGFNEQNMTISDTCTLGAAADYDNPFSHSIEYGKSPLTQVESVGGGGQFTVGGSDNHYTQFSYGDNAGRIFNYQSADLLVTQKTEPNDVKEYNYYNRERVHFATARVNGTDTLKTQYQYDGQMRLIKVFNPNYYNKQLAGHSAFTRSFEYDFVGNKIMERNPDAGSKYFVYSPDNQLRFSIDSVGLASDTNQITYAKYDALGRITEQGVIYAEWNRDSLQLYANTQPNYPSSSYTVNYYWRKRFTYDGDGTHFRQGKLIEATVNWDTEDSAEVAETYGYDEYGNITEKGLKATDFDTLERKVTYEYNLDNRITQINFPETSQPSVTYTYNGKGQTTAIGIPSDQDYYAAYEYGYKTIEYLNNGSFPRTYAKNNAGWITEINDPLFNETLSYEHVINARDSTYNYNGKIAELSNTKKWSSLTVSGSFTYDDNGRITQANYGARNPLSLGMDSLVSYDLNGNLKRIQTANNSPINFEYNEGTNQTKTIKGFPKNYTYNGNGAITAVPYGVSNISYDPVSLLTRSMSNNGLTVQYQYNGQNQRVLKTVKDSTTVKSARLYVHGLNDYPLVEVDKDSLGANVTTFYIYGPMGLIAAQQEKERLFMLKDHLGSIRVVIDTNNTVKAHFDYTTFGITNESAIDPSIAHFALNYRFTGQEYEPELGGLYNFKARIYDPGLGRFYSVDPLMQYPSPYEYVGDNPINYIDPSGEWGWLSTLASAVVATVVTVAVIATAPISAPLILAGAAIAAGTVAGTAAGVGTAMAVDGDKLSIDLVEKAAKESVISSVGAATGGGAASAFTKRAIIKVGAGAIGSLSAHQFSSVSSAEDVIRAPEKRLSRKNSSTSTPPTHTSISKTVSTPTPINTNSGIIEPEIYKKGQKNIGYYTTVDLSKVEVIVTNKELGYSNVQDNKKICPETKVGCTTLINPYRVIVKAKGQTTINSELWTDFYPGNNLIVNANFFDVIGCAQQEAHPCTNIFGLSISNQDLVSNWPKYKSFSYKPKKGGKNKNYNLDALLFSSSGKAHITSYTSLNNIYHQNNQIPDSIQNAVAGIYLLIDNVENGELKNIGMLSEKRARTAIGVRENGKELVVLVIDVDKDSPKGITYNDLITFFQKEHCTYAISLDGGPSSVFYYEINKAKPIVSRPMEKHQGKTVYRPIPNFIGFKLK